MADRSLKHLNYGHPGVANYDLENKDWSFSRQYTTRTWKQTRTLNGIHAVTTLATPPSVQFTPPHNSVTGTSIQKDFRNHVRKHPQLAPAAGVLTDSALVSAAISSTTSIYDPLVGSLLSFGSVTLAGEPRQVAALSAGECGNVLRLAILNKERHAWSMDRSLWVDGPTLKDAECGYWNEDAAPIQQVCFAQSEDRSSLLAVRLPTQTVIFRPVYHRRARAVKPLPYYNLPASPIDAHPILSIGVENTGGYTHSDVTFNPNSQLQFAIIDQGYTWSIWNIEHPRKGDSYTASSILRGPIIDPEDTDATGEDGWSRILWIADGDTLVVCNRRHLKIVSIEGATFAYLSCPPMFGKNSTDWILDVKQHPKHRRRFIVLTSTRLIVMEVTTSRDASDGSTEDAGAAIVLSWRHYRSAEDFTLQMSMQIMSENESCLVLHSRLNNLIQVYVFSEYPSGSPTIISTSDPSVLNLTVDGSSRITDIRMVPMQYSDVREEAYQPGPGRTYVESGIKFFRLFVTRADLSVHELVVYTKRPDEVESTHDDRIVENFTQSIIRHPRRGASKTHAIDEDEDFILLDGLTTVEALRSKTVSQVPNWCRAYERTSLHDARNHRPMLKALLRDGQGSSNSVDVSVVINQVRQILEDDPDLSLPPRSTLLELTHTNINVSDIDEASTNLRDLFSPEGLQDSPDFQRIATARVLDLEEDENSTISDVYDNILQHFVAPLPPEVPIRARQRKERLARQIAAEILLAIITIREHGLPESSTMPEGGVVLPILPSKPRDGIVDNTTQYPFTQTLPTPPHSSIPSSSIPPSSPPAMPFTHPVRSDPLTRLSKRLRNKDPSKDLGVIPPTISQHLTHWQFGKHPSTYDWLAAEQALQAEEDLDEQSQQQLEKERRKKERREKRQQRENELMRAKVESQPAVFPRSSPGPTFSGMASSSQVLSQAYGGVPFPKSAFGGGSLMVPQSQLEPGKFGGRPDKKKKKKGRISGF